MWILADMWRIVDKKVSLPRDPARDQAYIRRIGCAINISIKEDRYRWTDEAGEEI